jgi:glyoxylase-like metal-dependent hydrolase (beta-lactamase superfamily II)
VLLVEPATPYPDEQSVWLDWAKDLERSGRRLIAILLTHHHIDHVAGAARLSAELGLPLWAHAKTSERLPDIQVSRTLAEGDEIELDGTPTQRWRVLHTPGHAPGHVCLHEAETGTLVVGDMVASIGTILIAPGDGHMQTYLTELRRLEALGGRRALHAHGEPIPEPSRLFSHYVSHRLMREDKVIDALGAVGSGGGTADELVPRAYADTPVEAWPIARLSLLSHLEKLVSEERARVDGERYFSA